MSPTTGMQERGQAHGARRSTHGRETNLADADGLNGFLAAPRPRLRHEHVVDGDRPGPPWLSGVCRRLRPVPDAQRPGFRDQGVQARRLPARDMARPRGPTPIVVRGRPEQAGDQGRRQHLGAGGARAERSQGARAGAHGKLYAEGVGVSRVASSPTGSGCHCLHRVGVHPLRQRDLVVL